MKLSERCILQYVALFLFGFFVIEYFPSSFLPTVINDHGKTDLYDSKEKPFWTNKMKRYCLKIEQRIEKEKKDKSWEFLLRRNTSIVSPKLDKNSKQQFKQIPYYYFNWRSSPDLARRVTPCEHQIFTELLSILDHFFRRHDIPYMMMDGTLLGSYTNHDLLPWDDDVDLRISNRDRVRMFTLFDKEFGHRVKRARMNNEYGSYDIIYFPWAPKVDGQNFSYPYVDIVFMDENATHMWNGNHKSYSIDYCSIAKKDIFPLVWRPFGQIWLPAPREPAVVFETLRWRAFGKWYYARDFSHKYLQHIPSIDGRATPSQLLPYYPWIERYCTKTECSEKLLTMHNNRSIIIHVIRFEKYRTKVFFDPMPDNKTCLL